MVEVSVRIVVFELLNSPPRRSAIGDVAAKTFQHTGVKDGNHTTIVSKDE